MLAVASDKDGRIVKPTVDGKSIFTSQFQRDLLY